MCKYLPDVIRGFNDKYPHITFEIYQGSYEDIIYWLKTGIVDIGFLSQIVDPGLPFYEIFSDPLMCILPKETHTESESEIRLETLANAPFVMQRESCDADARQIMDKLNLEVRTICHVVDDKTTVEMVKSGFAFMLVEGYFHTHNLKKYLGRLLFWAILSELPFNLMYVGSPIYPFHQNVLWTFLLGLLCITVIEKMRHKGKPLLTLIVFWLSTAAVRYIFSAGALGPVFLYNRG